jgi:hypothetical protein
MADASDRALHTRRLLQAAIGVGFIGIAYLALGTPSGDERAVAAKSAAVAKTAEPARAPSSREPGATPAPPIASGGDMTQLLLEAKAVEAARSALASGDPKKALEELRFYEERTRAESLRQEATLLKIEALMLVGRNADAHALVRATRSDPSFDSYQGRIATLLANGADAAR